MKSSFNRLLHTDPSSSEDDGVYVRQQERRARQLYRIEQGMPPHDDYIEAVRIMRDVLVTLDLYDLYYTSSPDGSVALGNLGSWWYCEFRYMAALILSEHGADASRVYMAARLSELKERRK